MLKTVVTEQLTDEKLLVFEAKVDQDLQKLNHLQREMSRQSLLEEISKQVSDPNEKINLHELIETSNLTSNLISPKNTTNTSFIYPKTSAAKCQSFSLANVTSGSKTLGRKPPTPKTGQTVGLNKQKIRGSSMVLSPTSDSFMARAEWAIADSNGLADSNLLQIETTEQEEEASAQEIKTFTADTPMKYDQPRRKSISNFISDLIIEEALIEETPMPTNDQLKSDDKAIELDSEEDSFLEFIKEKPVIGKSPSIKMKPGPSPKESNRY